MPDTIQQKCPTIDERLVVMAESQKEMLEIIKALVKEIATIKGMIK